MSNFWGAYQDSPARVNMIIKASCLKSLEILRISGEMRLRTCGLKTIPTSNIPKSGGSLIFLNMLPRSSADNKIIAREVKNDI